MNCATPICSSQVYRNAGHGDRGVIVVNGVEVFANPVDCARLLSRSGVFGPGPAGFSSNSALIWINEYRTSTEFRPIQTLPLRLDCIYVYRQTL